MTIASTDPVTGEVWARYPALDASAIERRLADADRVWRGYRRTGFAQRRAWLVRAAELLDARVEEFAVLAAREMGKPLAEGRAEVSKCARACRYYAEHGEKFLAPEPADAAAVGAGEAGVRWQPLGPVLAVMPWNYPFWQVVRFAAPALMAGNVALVKPASNVPGCALALEKLFADAGFPAQVYQTLLIGSAAVSAVIADSRVAAVTLTGSGAAGRAVGEAAGRAVKKVVLELGGSDPFIVLPSADIEQAASVAVRSRFQNAGQSCISAKRFIVHRDCHDEFVAAVVSRASALRVGDPSAVDTDLGPMATATDELGELVEDAAALGAAVLCGGKPEGRFFPPTVVAGVTSEMRLYHEEAFGPVASIISVNSLDEAIEVANSTEFGLGAAAWTRDIGEQDRLVDELEAGAVFVNGMTASYPELPFGGVKASGYGRELAAFGIREFCNAKTVWKA
ncbi:NAD-dependent succinate-semialdehyde dehydrogenase [Amycolatopsis jejuensis]|uniref:NAD-dependent succinate-semialdehyde dehydrogenase n=1 Tax=Amycolatopsis jejuensis TaxID=330084 RepID=UPI000524FA62|nr:NAD-dependent succinate-semialdehyde dehydrogenase [Amycolatopsis jejuensis]